MPKVLPLVCLLAALALSPITGPGPAEAQQSANQTLQTLVVRNSQELIQAIGSNRRIILKPNLYQLRPELIGKHLHLKVEDNQIWIEDVENLIIQGEDLRTSKIVIEDALSQVLSFRRSRQVTLESLEMGHVPPANTVCLGAVLGFFESSEIRVRNCLLFGSGSFGIWTENSHHLDVEDSVIKECSQGLLFLHDSHHLNFRKVTFVDNVGGVNLSGESQYISFDQSQFINNYQAPGQYYTAYLFAGFNLASVQIKNSLIADNRLEGLSENASGPVLNQTRQQDNLWQLRPKGNPLPNNERPISPESEGAEQTG